MGDEMVVRHEKGSNSRLEDVNVELGFTNDLEARVRLRGLTPVTPTSLGYLAGLTLGWAKLEAWRRQFIQLLTEPGPWEEMSRKGHPRAECALDPNCLTRGTVPRAPPAALCTSRL